MNVAREPVELARVPRAVAIGTFDGVHVGHRAVIEAAREPALVHTVVTFDPHPRQVLGYGVELVSTLERRLELLDALGVEETLVVPFTLEVAALQPREFAGSHLIGIGAELVAAGETFRYGNKRRGDLELLRGLGLATRVVPLVPGVSSSEVRHLVAAGAVRAAAALLGRPFEVEGTVVSGDARGGTLGYPTANLRADPAALMPRYGIYAGWALGHRAAISIGVNPHFGGEERRIEAFLLDFQGDLYGRRLVVELWEHLRDERAFASEPALVAQIAEDVEAARAATRP
jgi:riboflavin kinase / FMN adenylyltransferase